MDFAFSSFTFSAVNKHIIINTHEFIDYFWIEIKLQKEGKCFLVICGVITVDARISDFIHSAITLAVSLCCI